MCIISESLEIVYTNDNIYARTLYHIRTLVKTSLPIWDTNNNVPEWKDKAGGYAIQGTFAKYVKRIEGDYYNVVGLPISRLYQELKKLNIV